MALRFRNYDRAVTIPELMIAIAAAAVLVLAGWAMWEMTRRETVAARARAECSRVAFAVLQRIQQEVMRAETIEVPDPDHATAGTIQLHVPDPDTGPGATVRRAFRLDGDEFIIDLKDENVAPFAPFDGISGLTFTVQDPPMNSRVLITCSASSKGEQVEMRTEATKRN